jgi:hypothetical protein
MHKDMDQLATVLEIMQDVRTLDTEQKTNVMQYIKGISSVNASKHDDSYRKRAIREIRSAFSRQAQF